MRKIFDIEWKRLVRWLVPVRLRVPRKLNWIYGLISPVIMLYQNFIRYRKAKLYQLKITPQVCYLELMLNDRFDGGDRRIYIDDAVWHLPWYAYQEDELKPKYMFQEIEEKPVITYTEDEAGAVLKDFVVFVPIGLVFNLLEMKGLLDLYKLAGTQYTIQYI